MIDISPMNDVIEHAEQDVACPCGPTLETLENGWQCLKHRAVDGREALEDLLDLGDESRPWKITGPAELIEEMEANKAKEGT